MSPASHQPAAGDGSGIADLKADHSYQRIERGRGNAAAVKHTDGEHAD